jgi:hypothetical protein
MAWAMHAYFIYSLFIDGAIWPLQKGSEKKGPPKKKERKNRLGQRARRALAEKIHGQNAKHLKAEQSGQRGGARQQIGHQQRPAASERRPPRNDKEGKKPFSKPRQQKDGWQASDANRTPLGQPSRTPPKGVGGCVCGTPSIFACVVIRRRRFFFFDVVWYVCVFCRVTLRDGDCSL